MAAPVLRSTAPRATDVVAAEYSSSFSSSRPRTVLVSAAVGRRRSGILPQFTGFRASVRRGKLGSATAAGALKALCRSTVVCEAREAAIEDVTNATWRSVVLDCDKPAAVVFWASWCEPCHVILPVIAKLSSSSYQGKMRFFKLNTDDNPETATQYEIRSIPTVVIFRSGEKMEKIIGAVSESTLLSFIDEHVER